MRRASQYCTKSIEYFCTFDGIAGANYHSIHRISGRHFYRRGADNRRPSDRVYLCRHFHRHRIRILRSVRLFQSTTRLHG